MEFFNAEHLRLPDDAVTLGIAMAGATLAATVFYTPIPLFLLIVILGLAYFLTRPYELLLAMVFLIPFNFVVPIGGVPVAAELLKVFLWIPYLIGAGKSNLKFRGSQYSRYLAVIGILIVASVFRSHDLPFTIKESVRLGSNIGLIYLVTSLITTQERVVQVMRVLMISTTLVVCYGFYQFIIQDYGAIFWIVNPRMDTAVSHFRDSFWDWRGRMVSVLTSEMEIAHYFNLCIPIGVYLWLKEDSGKLGSKWLWISVLVLVGLILTFTFGGWLTLAATGAMFVFSSGRKARQRILLAGSFVTSVILAVGFVGPFRSFMAEKITGTGMNSLAWDAATRFEMWSFAIRTWWSHPLFGVGIGNFEFLYSNEASLISKWAPAGSSPHQTYLYLLAMFGLVGTFCILRVLIGSIFAGLALRRDRRFAILGPCLAFALTTTIVSGFSDDSGFFGPHAGYLVWLLVAITEAVQRLAQADQAPCLAPAQCPSSD